MNKTINFRILWSLLNSFGNYGIIFAYNIYLTRLIEPDFYAVIITTLAFGAVLQLFIDVGLSQRLIVKRRIARRYMVLVAQHMFLRSVIIYIVGTVLVIAFWTNTYGEAKFYLFLLLIDFLFYPMVFYSNLMFTKKGLFKQKFINSMISCVVAILGSVICIFHQNYEEAFITFIVMSPCTIAILGFYQFPFKIKILIPNYKLKAIPWVSLSYVLSLRIEDFIRKALIGQFVPNGGVLLRSEGIFLSPTKILNTAIERVIASAQHITDAKHANIIFLLVNVLLSLILGFMIYLFSHNLMVLLLGDSWTLDIKYVLFLSLFIPLCFLNIQSASYLRMASGHNKCALTANLILIMTILSSIWIIGIVYLLLILLFSQALKFVYLLVHIILSDR